MNDESLPCADKITFDSFKLAEATRVVSENHYGRKLKSYKCRYCHLWHLASDYE